MHSPSHSRASSNYQPHAAHSYTSSNSTDSFADRVNSLTRSASGTSQTHYEDMMPSPQVLTDGYVGESWGNGQLPRLSVLNSRYTEQPDPVALHLLVETALDDSQEYSILPIEGLEKIKQEEASIGRQIQSLKRKLHLESSP